MNAAPTRYTKDLLYVYNGEFRNGKCEGYGISLRLNRSSIELHVGYFQNGYKCGHGARLTVDPKSEKLEYASTGIWDIDHGMVKKIDVDELSLSDATPKSVMDRIRCDKLKLVVRANPANYQRLWQYRWMQKMDPELAEQVIDDILPDEEHIEKYYLKNRDALPWAIDSKDLNDNSQ